jgi:hypothetical protein
VSFEPGDTELLAHLCDLGLEQLRADAKQLKSISLRRATARDIERYDQAAARLMKFLGK